MANDGIGCFYNRVYIIVTLKVINSNYIFSTAPKACRTNEPFFTIIP